MRKILELLLIFTFMLFNNAFADIENIPYKNIEINSKIKLSENGEIWTDKVSKKDENFLIKTVSDGSGSYSEYCTPEGEPLFSTGTHYEFIHKGSFIGYSNFDLKFYEFILHDKRLIKRELAEDEIHELFKDFEIVKLSEFRPLTNSLKIQKGRKDLKIILLNDTDEYFYRYSFSSNNAKFKEYPLRGLVEVTRRGMIQFSHFEQTTKDNPSYMILVR